MCLACVTSGPGLLEASNQGGTRSQLIERSQIGLELRHKCLMVCQVTEEVTQTQQRTWIITTPGGQVLQLSRPRVLHRDCLALIVNTSQVPQPAGQCQSEPTMRVPVVQRVMQRWQQKL